MAGGELKFLDLLSDLAAIFDNGARAGAALNEALALIAARLDLPRCAISAVDTIDGRIRICAAYGLAEEQIKAGEYLPGEGITGKVIARGAPVYIEDIAKEPLFLNRTGSRNPASERIAFSCAPIIYAGDVIGSLWLDQVERNSHIEPQQWLRILRVLAALFAPYVHVRGADAQNHASRSLKFGRFIGNSPAMQQIYAQIMQVAPSRLTVFLGGESGTGKELAARAIHEGSQRASGPFISVNCAAIPENLVESELFGHERGAFTGATQTRKGKFELAHRGTLFLDEIGETSLAVQARLLRVLQDRTFERIGGAATLQTDVRIIAATNRDLGRMVEEGTFRLDLFYRLHVFPICMPALRDRPDDIPLLADHFLHREAQLAKCRPARLSHDAIAILQSYDWPGNIRELENVMERSALLAHGEIVLPEHLPAHLTHGIARPSSRADVHCGNLKADLEEHEKGAILDALAASHGHIGKAAKNLGMTERVLALRLSRYGIDYKAFRTGRLG